MFRDVPGCSGMFHVPGFIDDPWLLLPKQSHIHEKKFVQQYQVLFSIVTQTLSVFWTIHPKEQNIKAQLTTARGCSVRRTSEISGIFSPTRLLLPLSLRRSSF